MLFRSEDLRPKVDANVAAAILIPIHLSLVQDQLKFGAVKVAFGQLRQVAPPAVFGPNAANDHRQVELPLQEILAQVQPGMIQRKSAQRQTLVPDEVTNVFGNKTAPAKPPVQPTAPPPVAASPAAPRPQAQPAPPPPVPAPPGIPAAPFQRAQPAPVEVKPAVASPEIGRAHV